MSTEVPERPAQIGLLCTVWKLLGRHGLVDGIFNHISCSFGGSEGELRIAISPAERLSSELASEEIRDLPLRAYSEVEAKQLGVNPDGLQLHTSVHLARQRPGYVVHLHPPHCVAVGATEVGLLPLNQTAIEFAEGLLMVDYEGLARSWLLPPQLSALALTGGEALLRNHGLLVVADTPAEAFYACYYMEVACRLQVLTLAQGIPVHTPDVETVKATAGALRADRKGAATAMYEAMQRLASESQ